MNSSKNPEEQPREEEEQLETPRPVESDKWAPVREHSEDEEEDELVYAQKYGMAWNPADHERFGMTDFERNYEDESTYTGQPYRTEGKHEDDSPTDPTPPTDAEIEADVREKLKYQGQINWNTIEVSVKDGEVTLDGTVREEPHRDLAIEALSSVAGVTTIHNRLRVE